MPFDQTVKFRDAEQNLWLFDSLDSIWFDIAFPWFSSFAYCEISYWFKRFTCIDLRNGVKVFVFIQKHETHFEFRAWLS